MSTEPPRHRSAQQRLDVIFAIDWDQVHLKTGIISLAVLLAIVGARIFVGPRIFVAAIAALFVLLVSARAKSLWKVVVFAAAYGAIITAAAERVNTSDTAALLFVGLVTFAAGVTVVTPLLSALGALLNLWAILAMNVIPTSDVAVRGAMAWLAGCSVAGAALWYTKRRRMLPEDTLVEITLTSLNLDRSIRFSVFVFAGIRAVCVVAAAGIGLLLFDKHQWWAALAALVVAGINAEESRKIAWQRAVGTVIGAVAASFLLTLTTVTFIQAALFLAVAFLTLMFRPASQTIFAGGLTVLLILAEALLGGSVYKLGGIRIIQTLIGIGFAILAIRLAQPALARIDLVQRERAKARSTIEEKKGMKEIEEIEKSVTLSSQ